MTAGDGLASTERNTWKATHVQSATRLNSYQNILEATGNGILVYIYS